jgi:Fe-S-cluster formation regulator IscX/YfhJ
MTKHLMTRKHRVLTQGPGGTRQKSKTSIIRECPFCSKTFKTRSGRSKHVRNCSNNTQDIQQKLEEANKKIDNLKNERIEALESQNKELLKIISKQKTGQTQNINTQNNNYINIQLYLDEKCKNAMPIMDFIKDLQFKLLDINSERPASTIESLGKCITDKLEDMDVTERPMHCSDVKRLVFHVKDASGWAKDVDNKKIDKAIGWANMRHQGAWHSYAKKEGIDKSKVKDTDYHNMNVAMAHFSDDPKKAKGKIKRVIASTTDFKNVKSLN